jgi:hypothetical protein
MVLVGLLRPRRKVLDPSGAEWEVYVSRMVLPPWRPTDHEVGPLAQSNVLGLVIEGCVAIVGAILVPLLRLLAALPGAWLRGRRSPEYRIEAVTWWPHRQTQTWTTTAENLDEALIAISAGIRRGRPAQPACAVFLGARGT